MRSQSRVRRRHGIATVFPPIVAATTRENTMRTLLQRCFLAASIAALSLGVTACDEDLTADPDAGETSGGGRDSGGGTGTTDAGGGGGTLDASIQDDSGSGGGGTTDTGTTEPDPLTCAEINDCINAFGAGVTQDQALECINQGTPEAQTQFQDAITCVQDNCADVAEADQLACQQENCGDELNACLGGGGGGGDLGEGNDSDYALCDESTPCESGSACTAFEADAASGFCIPSCVDGACPTYGGAPAACVLGAETDPEPTGCLPSCTDTAASSDCPTDYTCTAVQGGSLCLPPGVSAN